MSPSSRFIRARVVGPIEFAGEGRDASVAGPKRRVSKKERQLRRKLRRARTLKRRVAQLRIRKPLGWKGAVQKAKLDLRVVVSDLHALGWRPKKPRRALKPGEDEMDAALDDIPEAEPGETEEADENVEELPASPDDATEGNWLDGHVGAEPKKRPVTDLFKRAGAALAPKWSKPVPLGDGGQIQTRPGQRAMIMSVSPGLFVVQLVSDAAAQKLAGDNVGVLPLVLYPLVKSRILQKLGPQPAQPGQPAGRGQPAGPGQPAQPGQPAPVGCDGRRCGG